MKNDPEIQKVIDRVNSVLDNITGQLDKAEIPYTSKKARNLRHALIYLGPVKSPKSGDEVGDIGRIEIWPDEVKLGINAYIRGLKTTRRYKVRNDNTVSDKIVKGAKEFIDIMVSHHENRKENQKSREEFEALGCNLVRRAGLVPYASFNTIHVAFTEADVDACKYLATLRKSGNSGLMRISISQALKPDQVEEFLKMVIKFHEEPHG